LLSWALIDVRVYTGGTFDRFHNGHRDLLRYCREVAGPTGTVVVGLNTDEFVKRFKGKAPAQDYSTRLKAVLAEPVVDIVVANIGDEDSRPAIEGVAPDALVIGSDWHDKGYLAQLGLDFDWLNQRRIVLVYAPRPSGGPTTSWT
jgi:cytidyltransferase-like protein